MMVVAHTEKPEGRAPTQGELIKVWNLLCDYERSPNHCSDSLSAALRAVKGFGPAVVV